MFVYMLSFLLLHFPYVDLMKVCKGALGVGRHASTILLGRNLWETPALPDDIDKKVEEPSFKNTFPTANEAFDQDINFDVDI